VSTAVPIETRIWHEEPEADDPMAVRTARCHGYDVHGEMLGNARWADMIHLLFRGEAPAPAQAALLDGLAVALANPGPRDPSVHAAMCGGVGGSPMAASLMAALAAGAGQLAGGREVFAAMKMWRDCGNDPERWRNALSAPVESKATIWPIDSHAPGFDPNGTVTAGIVLRTLARLAAIGCGWRLSWLESNRETMESAAGAPLALSGIAAAAFADLGFDPAEGEALHLILRLPGAAAHALEQQARGHRKFPFFEIELCDPSEAGEPR